MHKCGCYEIWDKGEATGIIKLAQGELIKNCLLLFFPSQPDSPELSKQILDAILSAGARGKIEVDISICNVVVLSQSCDLEWDKLDLVLVAPFYSREQFEKMVHHKYGDEAKEECWQAIAKGYAKVYYRLGRCESEEFGIRDELVVEFKRAYAVPPRLLELLVAKQRERIRLTSPSREHLAHAFGDFISRVALPDPDTHRE
jgi:hypothetical protein